MKRGRLRVVRLQSGGVRVIKRTDILEYKGSVSQSLEKQQSEAWTCFTNTFTRSPGVKKKHIPRYPRDELLSSSPALRMSATLQKALHAFFKPVLLPAPHRAEMTSITSPGSTPYQVEDGAAGSVPRLAPNKRGRWRRFWDVFFSFKVNMRNMFFFDGSMKDLS